MFHSFGAAHEYSSSEAPSPCLSRERGEGEQRGEDERPRADHRVAFRPGRMLARGAPRAEAMVSCASWCAIVAVIANAMPAAAQIARCGPRASTTSPTSGGYANAGLRCRRSPAPGRTPWRCRSCSIDVQSCAVYHRPNYKSQSVIAATIVEAMRAIGRVDLLGTLLDPSKIGSYHVGDWRSTYNPTDVAAFFASYKTMIVGVAQLAQANGGELEHQRRLVAHRTSLPIVLDRHHHVGARGVSGTLTCSSDWDDAISPWGQRGLPANSAISRDASEFWSVLDYLGIDCYAVRCRQSDGGTTRHRLDADAERFDVAVGHRQPSADRLFFSRGDDDRQAARLHRDRLRPPATPRATPSAPRPTSTIRRCQANLYAAFFEAWQQSGNNALTGVYFWVGSERRRSRPGNDPNFSPQGQPLGRGHRQFHRGARRLERDAVDEASLRPAPGDPFSPSFLYQLQATSGSVGYDFRRAELAHRIVDLRHGVDVGGDRYVHGQYQRQHAVAHDLHATITFTNTTNNDTAQTTSATLTVNAPC